MTSFDVPWITDPDPDQPKGMQPWLSTHKRTTSHPPFFTPSQLGSVLSSQVRLTAANTLKIDILFHCSFPV